MKNTLITLLISLSSFSFAQYGQVSPLDHDTVLNKKFSIVFYIVVDSTYSVGMATTPTLTMLIDTLNSRFKHIGVSFQSCSTVVIPNYTYSKWQKNVTDPVVTSNWYTDKTINFYIVDSIRPDPTNTEIDEGYAYGPPVGNATPKDAIIMAQAALNGSFPFVFHHMGHFFGLVHTSAEIGTGPPANPMPPSTTIVSQEFANGSNCSQHGDCLCDTEADPGTFAQVFDGNGMRYIQPVDNYMSPYSTICRYTQQQYNLMAYMILTRRLYLH